jgi:hypothetical protein
VHQRAPIEPQVYRERFALSLRRPSRSILSRFLAHTLIRLLIVSALPAQWQAAAAFFPVSVLTPLLDAASDDAQPDAAALCGPETRVRGYQLENAPRVARESLQAAEPHRAYRLGYDGSAVESPVGGMPPVVLKLGE